MPGTHSFYTNLFVSFGVMKRIASKACLLVGLFTLCASGISYSQSLTGIWRGYFISDDGEQYKLEFQVKQNQTFAVTGVSYSYLDVRFYGKATMTGSYTKGSKNFRIREIRTVEVKSATGFGTCIMNYDLVYSKSGKEEFLEGTYLGKQETKENPNPYKWGDCGGGTVYLRKVPTSDFYIEPFLRKKTTTTPPTVLRKDTVKKVTPAVVEKKPPVRTNPVTKTTTTRKNNDITTRKENKDSAVKIREPLVTTPIKPSINTPAVLKERANELMKSLVVNDPDVTVKLYDNGEIDDDTISIYYDKKLLMSSKRLSGAPIVIKLKMDDENESHELVMVAENLGRIPPNTALMIVNAGDQRFDVRITSTEQKNALVRFKYEKPK